MSVSCLKCCVSVRFIAFSWIDSESRLASDYLQSTVEICELEE